MSFFPARDPVPGDAFSCDAIELMLVARAKDIGGFEVRRALPSAQRQMVGPFIFFDRWGRPIRAGRGDRRAAAPAYRARHRHLSVRRRDPAPRQPRHLTGDPAGRRQLMTAGRGIAHSERSPEATARQPLSIRAADLAGAARRQGRNRSAVRTYLEVRTAGDRVGRRLSPHRHRPVRRRALAGRDGIGHALCGPPAGRRAPACAFQPSGGAGDLRSGRNGDDLRRPVRQRTCCSCSGRATKSWSLPNRARISCCSAALPWAPSGIYGGISCRRRRNGSNRQRNEWKTRRFDIVPGDEEEFIPLPEN